MLTLEGAGLESARLEGARLEDTGEETDSIALESDMLLTAFWTLVFSLLSALVVYYSIGATTGDGLSILRLIAAVAGVLACAAVACRYRIVLRLMCTLASLFMVALLVDQVAYSGWHEQVDGLVAGLQRDIAAGPQRLAEEMEVRPSSFSIQPDQELVLNFEPPLLAWTYHLGAAAPSAQVPIEWWFGILALLPRGHDLDPVAQSLVQPHEAYRVSVVTTEEEVAVCRVEDTGQWILSVDTHTGFQPL